jgi:outer membrane protein assembly factor BamB
VKYVILLLATGLAVAGDWPQFRGPSASGISDAKNPPVQFDVTKNTGVIWKVEIPGLAVSSPIVSGDRIYVTTAISSAGKHDVRTGLYGDTDSLNDRSEHEWRVLSIDRATGKIVWQQTSWKGIPKTKRHPKSSQASPTPATNGDVVVAYFGSEGLYAYSNAGKLLWKQDLGLQNAGWFFDPDSEWGAASSPIIYKDAVIVQCDRQKDSYIAAFDLKTGKQLWRTARPEIPTWGTPTLVKAGDKFELVTNGAKAIRGYDPDTGKELWTLGPNSEVVCTTPVAGEGLVFITAGYPPVQPIYAVKPGSRGDLTLPSGKESSDSIAWSKSRGGVYLPSPIVYGEHLYTISNNGILSVYEAKNGNRVYQQRIGTGGSFVGSPIVAANRLYVVNEEGELYIVKTGPQYELIAKNVIGEPVLSTPAFAGDWLIIRGTKHLFAIGESKQ